MTPRLSPAIILRVKEFGESDLLVSCLTQEEGRLRGVAKGARRSRKRFANCLDLFCLVNLEYAARRHGDLYLLHSCKLIQGFPRLRTDYTALTLASHMVEITERLFPPGVKDKEVFELLKRSFVRLDAGGPAGLVRAVFEARAMAHGGYGINTEACCVCNRPYEGKGRAVFVPDKGRIACLRCVRESGAAPGLDVPGVTTLRLMQSAPWSVLEALNPPGEVIGEIQAVLKRHTAYRLGEGFRSARYL
jgi:DNA repair protein RecO (recombination protein O)